jgi:hypothetical protein
MPSPAQSNEPSPLAELWLFERKLYSQNGEDGVLNAIFEVEAGRDCAPRGIARARMGCTVDARSPT